MAVSKNQKLIDNLQKKINEAFEKSVDKKALEDVAKKTADDIRTRTRLGYGVNNTGDLKNKLKPLKNSTVKKRTIALKRGELSPFTTPRRSNLTKTGQLLDALSGRAKNKGVEIILKKEKRTDTNVTNSEIVFHQEAHGRPFIHLSKPEITKLNNRIKEILFLELKRKKII